ncbi:hypothetical protein [Nesterenkonia populi]
MDPVAGVREGNERREKIEDSMAEHAQVFKGPTGVPIPDHVHYL